MRHPVHKKIILVLIYGLLFPLTAINVQYARCWSLEPWRNFKVRL